VYQVWDLFYDADSVRKMLTGKIKEESLRTYLFTYSNVYDSISIVSNVERWVRYATAVCRIRDNLVRIQILGSVSSDPDPAPVPVLFVSDLQDANR
jgi:hypothetical protein